ncbi:MAG: SsrA-binding protein SmpB [Candidatus Spechtbacterales bacterium]
MADYARNKRAYFDYDILEEYEAGIQLFGYEVKSVRAGRASLAGSFVLIRGEEAFLTNVQIPAYQPGNAPASYDPLRTRRLLLHKKELKELTGRAQVKGLTLVPLRLYNKNGKIKLMFGLAKGKRKYDKRETVKKRDIEREVGRRVK